MPPSVLEGARRALLARLVLNGLAQAAIAIGLALLVDKVLTERREVFSAPGELVPALVSLFLGAAAYIALRAWQRRDAEAFGLSFIHDLRIAVFRHACALLMSAKAPSLGQLLTRLTNDLLAVKNWVSFGITGIVVAASAIAAALSFLALVEWRLAASSAIALGITAALAALAVPALDRAVRKARNQRGRLASNLGEKLLGRHGIQALGRTEAEVRKIEEQSSELTNLLIQRGLLSGVLRHAPDAALPVAVCTVVVVGSLFPPPSGVSGATRGLIAWFFVMGVVMSQLSEVARSWDYWINYKPAMRRVRALLALPAITDAVNAVSVRASDDLAIMLRDVAPYPGAPTISGRIAPGDYVTLAGGAAEARSALLRRIARLDAQGEGEIVFAGVPIDRVVLREYRRHVALVSPDVPLLPGTIGGNIRKGAGLDGDTAWLAEVARVCGLITSGQPLETVLSRTIGEGGRGLSEGLDARVRLCRALVRRPSFLLLDDAKAVGDARLMEEIQRHAAAHNMGVVASREPDGGKLSENSTLRLVRAGPGCPRHLHEINGYAYRCP